MKWTISLLVLTLVCLLQQISANAAYDDESNIVSLARDLEASCDNLRQTVHQVVPAPRGEIADAVRSIDRLENAADHYRNQVVSDGPYSRDARDNFEKTRHAWNEAQDAFRWLPATRRIAWQRDQVEDSLRSITRFYRVPVIGGGERGEFRKLTAGIIESANRIAARAQPDRDARYRNQWREQLVDQMRGLRLECRELAEHAAIEPYQRRLIRNDFARMTEYYNAGLTLSSRLGNQFQAEFAELGQLINALGARLG